MNSISNSRRLRQQIEWVLPELSTTSSAMVMHPQFREIYPEWMMIVHQMIRATIPLMRTALQRCRELEDTDTVAAAMAPYLEQHIKEEMHHDDWLLEDLELIGVPRTEVLRRMPSPAVASLIGAHYYWIHHHHPVAKLGQIAVMEGYPPSAEWIDLLAARSGYARPAFRTLEKHCHLDANHRDDFDDALDRMPLQEKHHAILKISALHTVNAAVQVYRELLKQFAGAQVPEEAAAQRALMPLRRPDLGAIGIGNNGRYRLDDGSDRTSYQIGEQEHFLLTQCDGVQSLDEVCLAYDGRFGETLSRQELNDFLEMAQAEDLFAK